MATKPFTSRYMVDTVPLWLRPVHSAFSYFMAAWLFSWARTVYHTSRIEVIGRERLDHNRNHIFCFWHLFSPEALSAFPRPERQVWMQHPGWMNKHMHVVVRLFGVKVVPGSTGFRGREAADEIVEHLERGYSTVVFPDAPRGPRCELKDGVLHMARQSGVPIAPVRISVARYLELRGWDRKRMPLPFNRMRVEYAEPIRVEEENFNEARQRLVEALGMPD